MNELFKSFEYYTKRCLVTKYAQRVCLLIIDNHIYFINHIRYYRSNQVSTGVLEYSVKSSALYLLTCCYLLFLCWLFLLICELFH